jgi:hypothetical protein
MSPPDTSLPQPIRAYLERALPGPAQPRPGPASSRRPAGPFTYWRGTVTAVGLL